ncbi:hypothetical protein [Microbacterium sp. NPDC057650]|uniref:hypothetical protein n=1 Tax=unclassified Microbacterium TaxID=2609290 RepID=UPI0036703AE1
MPKPDIDDLLAGSAGRYEPSAATRASLDALVTQTRAAAGARRPRRHRLLWVLPVAVLGVGALTAGAVVVDDLLHADLPIAVEYTTDTGVTVSCTAQIRGGSLFSPQKDEVVNYYRTHDFSGIGERVYDYAMVLSGDHQATPGVLPKSSEWIPEEGSFAPDVAAFSQSLTSFLLTDALVDLGIGGSGDASLTSDCTGQLR